MDMATMMLEMDHQKFPPHSFSDFSPNPNLPVVSSPASTTSLSFYNPIIEQPTSPSLPLFESRSRTLKSSSDAVALFSPVTNQYYDQRNSTAAMREMIFRIAVMQPIYIDPESVKPPKRRNVRISKDPQSVAARHRRERISEKIRILQRLVPGGTKMDTASMLDEAVHYVKFLKKQVQAFEQQQSSSTGPGPGSGPSFGPRSGPGFGPRSGPDARSPSQFIKNKANLNCANSINYSSALLKASQQYFTAGNSLQMR